ncbi:MAG: LPXTG cell wall anchor domain-containing protein [Candidatus Saccharimonadales bacterium]
MNTTPEPQASPRRVSKVSLLRSAIVTTSVVGIGLFSATVLAQTGGTTYRAGQVADHVTLNAVTNNPTHGDERNFVLIRPAGNGDFTDSVQVQPNREYEVYSYFHNNAASSMNASGEGQATGVRLSTVLPKTVGPAQAATLTGTLQATNATPQSIQDDVSITADHPTVISYVSSSAVIHSNGPVNAQVLPDAVATPEGALVGYDSLNGVLPGGTEHAGYVLYRIKTAVADCQDDCPAAAITELPKTGVEQTVSVVMMSLLLVASIGYYITSRQALHASQLGHRDDQTDQSSLDG